MRNYVYENALCRVATDFDARLCKIRHVVLSVDGDDVANKLYHKILARFPKITTMNATKLQRKQQTLHYIKTTTGQPEACRSRKLAPNRYQAGKTEFSQLMKEDIIRPKAHGRRLSTWYPREQAHGGRAEIIGNSTHAQYLIDIRYLT